MRAIVLGSAAGGGFPQWNCNARLSRLAWDRDARVLKRTQSSIAISQNQKTWVIFNASPDIRQQILQNPELQPDKLTGTRNSPISGVVLTNGDVDHVAGLLSLRERQAFHLYGTAAVLDTLAQNPIFRVLDPVLVPRIPLEINTQFHSEDLTITPFLVPGKVALYMETEDAHNNYGTRPGDTIGLEITAPGNGRLVYIPGCGEITSDIVNRVRGADCLLFDGTVFTDSELKQADVGMKTGRRMGHVPIMGEGGSLRAFDEADVRRKIYIHINTTNPILELQSEAEQIVIKAGWEIAFDGMIISL